MKNSRGITLIVLVITIIVIVILAGVTLSVTIGENGVLTQAQTAKEATEKAAKDEEKEFESVDMQMAEVQNKESWDSIINSDKNQNSEDNEGEEGEEGTEENELTLEEFQASFAGGTGTESNPYQITTPLHLAYLAKYTNEQVEFVTGSYFKLMNDLDLEWREWTAIGIGDPTAVGTNISTPNKLAVTAFKGHFDGDGHKISKLYINQNKNCAVGLFGTLDGNSVIQNVTIESGRIIGRYHVGGIAGASMNGTVKNCINKAEVIAQDTTTDSLEGENAGGIIGSALVGTSLIENCINYGDVTTKNDMLRNAGHGKCAGGILGNSEPYGNEQGIAIIKNCTNYGKITAEYQQAGGIVGLLFGGTIENCINHGKVYVKEFNQRKNSGALAGGIVAWLADSSMNNCKNTGEIIAEVALVGGIVGVNEVFYTNSTISNCENQGKVQQLCKVQAWTKINPVGGIVGHNKKGTVEYCYNTGTIESKIVEGIYECAGGIAGLNNGNGKIQYCYNNGQILNSNKQGGVIGHVNTGTLTKNYYYSDTLTTGIGCNSTDLTAEANGTDVSDQAEIIDAAEARTISSFEGFKTWIETK